MSDEKSEGQVSVAGNRPIVVASNRLPFTISRSGGELVRQTSAGGLVSAMKPVLKKQGGTWIGWPGIEMRPGEEIPQGDEPYRINSVLLSEGEIARYLHGFSNRTLWPLFHSLATLARFETRDYQAYERVNERFGSAIAQVAGDDDLIWIHDYHLMLAPDHVRRIVADARIAFFLHIPFPPYDIFRLLPWDREILRGLLACDLIGFHVPVYAQNFLDCVERRLGARVDRERMVVDHGDRAVRVGDFPIGIDFSDFEQRAKATTSRRQARERIILGVDRLDYTKGIPERIRAMARLLELHPEHREKVVLLQIAVPSRAQVAEYRDLKREIDELVGQVNGRFATSTWSPIRYLYRSFSQERLAAIYRDADVALVTPLRDGMNLVAKEFVAAQVDNPGVLVLSTLAGAAETMREALLVNPYDMDGTAEAVHRALTMDESERQLRVDALRAREIRDNVHAWVTKFVSAAAEGRAAVNPLTDRDFAGWLDPYLTRPRLALFLDYDGTMTPLTRHPSEAILSDQGREWLERCANRDDTDLAIVSGRALTDIKKIIGDDSLTYAGNHGLEIHGTGLDDFEHEDLHHYRERIDELARALEEVAVDGAWTEAKGPTLTFHYRAVPREKRLPLIERATELITQAGFQARGAHQAIEGRPPIGWDKGRAVLHILRARYGPSWSDLVRVIYVGDDQTDEDAFRFLSGLAATFRVGPADTLTAATRRLPNVAAVHSLLDWLGRR